MSYYADITLELNENIEARVTVYFDCISEGYRATWTEPGEGPEFDIDQVEINYLDCGGEWERCGSDLGDWYDVAHKKVMEALDNYGDLYHHQCDIYYSDPYYLND